MKPLTEITDLCLSKMKPDQIWTWEKWWKEIVGLDLPLGKSWAMHKWIELRNRIKGEVNRELARFMQAERLMCVGEGKGLYMVSGKEIADVMVEKKVLKFISHVERANEVLDVLSKAKNMSLTDKNTCKKMAGAFQMQGNALIGTMGQMRSLPKPLKKTILKKLGVGS